MLSIPVGETYTKAGARSRRIIIECRSVIDIFIGPGDNVFWRCVDATPNKIEVAGAKALCETDAEPLGIDIIHFVISPLERFLVTLPRHVDW